MTFFEELHADPDSRARVARLHFHGPNGSFAVETPVFMPVGTRASVKALSQEDLEELGYRLILANTYHLKLRPGDELIRDQGGVKKFMSWNGALLTDSGGYQAFSLAERVQLRKDGIEFSSHIDGSRHFFTPRGTVDIQRNLGSDIMMVLDDCPPADADETRLRDALRRTHDWARESSAHYEELKERGELDPLRSRLFGIIQGGIHPDFRAESAETVQSLPFDGIAVGGLSVGETRERMYETLEFLGPLLDASRPRYLMGVGTIPDFLEAVKNGIDMFDCVLPTRNARNGQVFSRMGKVNLKNAVHARADRPIDAACDCPVCGRYSLAYLRHLFLCKEMLGPRLATVHNLAFIRSFMSEMRQAIRENRFSEFYKSWIAVPL